MRNFCTIKGLATMIVDTSAIVAILRGEPDARIFAEAIAGAGVAHISAVNFVEAAAVINSARNPVASRRFDDFVREARLSIEPVTSEQARLARDAYKDFGKGSGHAAGLNLSGIALRTPWLGPRAKKFYSRAMISVIRIFCLLWKEANDEDDHAGSG